MPRVRSFLRSGTALGVCLAAIPSVQAQPAGQSEAVLEMLSVEGSGIAGGSELGNAPGGLTRSRTNLGPLGDRRVVETPFSTTGFTEKLIRDQEASTISDTLKNDPSVTIPRTRGTFFDIPYIRGFPVGNSNLLLNGLPSLLGNGQVIPVEPFARFEVLKGPAAFFYGTSGFAGVGGAVNLVTKRAPLSPVDAVTFGYTERSLVRTGVDWARRWGSEEEFGLRINGAGERGGSNVDGLRIVRALGSLAFDWRANERLRFSFDALYSQYDIRGYQNGLTVSPIGQLPFIPRAPKLTNTVTQPWAFYPTTLAVGIARVEYDITDDWTLGASYGIGYAYRPTVPSPGAPTLLNPAGDIRIAASYADYQAYEPNQSFAGNLRGRFRTGDLKHELVVTSDVQSSRFIGVPPTSLPAVISNIYLPRLYARPDLPPDGRRNKQFDSLSYGIGFTDIVSTPDDRFFVLAGGRYSNVTYANYNVANGARLNQFEGGRFNPIAAIGFRPTPDSLLYANYAEAFERGGVAPPTASNANVVLPPLTSNAIEFGAKAEFGGVIGTVAFFQIDKGLEYLRNNTFVQDGRQIHRGVEILVQGEVTPAFRVIGGIQALDPFVKNTANPANEGNDPVGVPRLQTSLFLEHDLAFLPGASVNAGIYHSSRQFVDLENARTIPDWTRLDLGARYDAVLPNGVRTTTRLVVENVFDTNYWSSMALGSLALGVPRTVKASVTLVW
ncbi:UNVERIFIED_CONTAM: TonB-dependent siderophore receptor [Methylobacteriaceae bacterium AG10]|nr:TonB-dependent siderophore receptor [Methylobacteriaceae bacterium AG10]